MLTQENVATLSRPFRMAEHEWRENRFVYVAESAVTARIEEVDPSWTMVITRRTVRDQQVITDIDLTIAGVTRPGVGMSSISTSSGGRETNEAEKASVTDALRRAARLFGVGRYLLNVPDSVTPNNFGPWLAEQQRAAGMSSEPTPSAQKPTLPPLANAPGMTTHLDTLPNGAPMPEGRHEPVTPARVNWSKWLGDMAKEGYPPTVIFKVLGVKNLNDYTGTPDEARALLLQHTQNGGK